jgi:hypothetical protein
MLVSVNYIVKDKSANHGGSLFTLSHLKNMSCRYGPHHMRLYPREEHETQRYYISGK